MFTECVKVKLSRGGYERMLMQDDDPLSTFSREPLEANAEIDLFAREKLFAEAANFTKCCGFAKNK